MGGNVCIKTDSGSHFASDIDLRIVRRSEIVPVLLESLFNVNIEFNRRFGFDLWIPELMNSLEFFSGSSRHFFDPSIDDQLFVSIKPSIGDIDVQVPEQYQYELETFLEDNIHCGDLHLIGFKKSAGQLISLWKSETLHQNIQIDFELVAFREGFPTNWAKFSHSSSWKDMQKGIKGVAQKMLLRALQAPQLNAVIIRGKRKDKEELSAEYAFSVTHGIRKKIEKVVDDHGNHVKVDNKQVFKPLSPSESKGITDITKIFEYFFGVKANGKELKDMESFVGLIKLIKKYKTKDDHKKIFDGFINTMWGKQAQGLYRNDPQKDLDEKMKIVKFLESELGLSIKGKEQLIADYYENY